MGPEWGIAKLPKVYMKRSANAGFLIVALLGLLGLLSLLVCSMAMVALQDTRAAQSQVATLQAYYRAEGKIDQIVAALRADDLRLESGTIVNLAGLTGAAGDTAQDLGGDKPVRVVVTGSTPSVSSPYTLTAYVRTKMPDFLFDALVYTPFIGILDGVSFTGNDPNGAPPKGGLETDRGNIWVSKTIEDMIGLPSEDAGVGSPAQIGYYEYWGPDEAISTYVNTRVIKDPSMFPAPRFRLEGPNGLIQRAKDQSQRDPLTGAPTGKTNYYDATRLQALETGEESLPTDFWYPEFNVVTVSHPVMGEPITQQVPRVPDPETSKPNIVVLDFPDKEAGEGWDWRVNLGQTKIGGFIILDPGNQPTEYAGVPYKHVTFDFSNLQEDQQFKGFFDDTKAIQRVQIDAVIYGHDPAASFGTHFWSLGNNYASYDWRGALWGGSGFQDDWWSANNQRSTMTYTSVYADAIKRLNLPAEIQVLAIKSGRDGGTGSEGGGPGENDEGTVGDLANDLTDQLPPEGQSALADAEDAADNTRTTAEDAGAPPSVGHTADDAVRTARQQQVPQPPAVP